MMLTVTWEAALTACASRQFADKMSAAGPYQSMEACIGTARRIWWQEVGVEGWLEAFAAHPEIGDADALKAKFSNQAFGALSHGEQAAALSNPDPFVFEELAALNKAYKAKHGFIFIICASGKSAAQMLSAVKQRLPNAPYTELGNAAREQMKITELRLEKLLSSQASPAAAALPSSSSGGGSSPAERAAVRTGQLAGHLAPTAAVPASTTAPAAAAGSHGPLRSPITTHVLDTSLGRPAQGLPISLHRLMEGSQRMWDCLGGGLTDGDGRIGNLMAPAGWVAPGVYQMRFDTGTYLRACREAHPDVFRPVPFYPKAVIEFTITPDTSTQHFHIPLLLNPYGYSTYRGS